MPMNFVFPLGIPSEADSAIKSDDRNILCGKKPTEKLANGDQAVHCLILSCYQDFLQRVPPQKQFQVKRVRRSGGYSGVVSGPIVPSATW